MSNPNEPYSLASDLAGYAFWGAAWFAFVGGGWLLLAGGVFGVGILLGMFV